MTLWDEIMQKSPVMKQLVENKIVEEVALKQVEIDELRAELDLAKAAIDELILNGGAL